MRKNYFVFGVLFAACSHAGGGAPGETPTQATPQQAAPAVNQAQLANLPPMIEREIFFGDPEIASGQISPNGKWISFRKPFKDKMNVWVKAADAPFESAKPVTADTERP